ncbi:hypothetical protein D3C76_1480910 [compost metagenome]
MPNTIRLACVTVWLLLICACQSWSNVTPPAVPACLPPPQPAAWIMTPYAPDLTRRMLDELSPSPTAATRD